MTMITTTTRRVYFVFALAFPLFPVNVYAVTTTVASGRSDCNGPRFRPLLLELDNNFGIFSPSELCILVDCDSPAPVQRALHEVGHAALWAASAGSEGWYKSEGAASIIGSVVQQGHEFITAFEVVMRMLDVINARDASSS
jgi:hypothetical protein